LLFEIEGAERVWRRPCTGQPRSRLLAVGLEASCVAVQGGLDGCGDAELFKVNWYGLAWIALNAGGAWSLLEIPQLSL
jgi:hypothetical protein